MPQYSKHRHTRDDGNNPQYDTRRWRSFTNGGYETPKLLGNSNGRVNIPDARSVFRRPFGRTSEQRKALAEERDGKCRILRFLLTDFVPPVASRRKRATAVLLRLPKPTRIRADAFTLAVNELFGSPSARNLPRRPQQYGLSFIPTSCQWDDVGRIKPWMRAH